MSVTDEPETDWAEAAEARVLDAAIRLAPDVGWNPSLVTKAAAEAGLSPADAELLLPHGPRDLLALFWRRHDRKASEHLLGIDPATRKIRERIRLGVEARVDAAAADELAVRRATLYLAASANAPLALSLAWESADRIWRWAGDISTDENHYSKRAILAGILTTTLAVRLASGAEAASRYLERRIENVMAFEKWKAGLPKAQDTLNSLAGVLGRLRYGARRQAPVSGEAAPAD